MLSCPVFTLTWYPGGWPSEDSPLVLQSLDHYVDGYAALGAKVADLIQAARFVRGSAPKFYNKGSRETQIDWEEVRKYATPSAALAEGLDIVASMPDEEGWLRIEIPDEGRAFVAIPCMIESAGAPKVEQSGAEHLLRLRWNMYCGPLTEIAVDSEEGAWLWEDGTEILWEDGDYLALEEMT